MKRLAIGLGVLVFSLWMAAIWGPEYLMDRLVLTAFLLTIPAITLGVVATT